MKGCNWEIYPTVVSVLTRLWLSRSVKPIIFHRITVWQWILAPIFIALFLVFIANEIARRTFCVHARLFSLHRASTRTPLPVTPMVFSVRLFGAIWELVMMLKQESAFTRGHLRRDDHLARFWFLCCFSAVGFCSGQQTYEVDVNIPDRIAICLSEKNQHLFFCHRESKNSLSSI